MHGVPSYQWYDDILLVLVSSRIFCYSRIESNESDTYIDVKRKLSRKISKLISHTAERTSCLHDEVREGAPTAAGRPGRLRWPIGDLPNRKEVSVGWSRPHR